MPIPPDDRYIPPRSPNPLIQELHVGEPSWPWRVLVLCSMLNQTSRTQVEPVSEKFFRKWPTPWAFAGADDADVKDVVRSLGLSNRRTASLKRMTYEYLSEGWEDVSEIHGVGKYARDAWAIFVEGRWDDVDPDDHALNDYHRWISSHRPATGPTALEWLDTLAEVDRPSIQESLRLHNWAASQRYLTERNVIKPDDLAPRLALVTAVESSYPPVGTPAVGDDLIVIDPRDPTGPIVGVVVAVTPGGQPVVRDAGDHAFVAYPETYREFGYTVRKLPKPEGTDA